MSDQSSSMTNPEQDTTVSVVVVPEELREQVSAYVKDLMREDDVSGHMMQIGSMGTRLGGTLNFTGTNCRWVKAGDGKTWQMACADMTP